MPIFDNKPEVRRGRPRTEKVREEARLIGNYLAAGYQPAEIRKELKLTVRQYKYRMSMLRKRAWDAKEVWPKFFAKLEARYRQFESIRQRAIKEGKLDTAMRAVENMKALDQSVINVGQDLGVYETKDKIVKHKVEGPTLSVFHEPPEKQDGDGFPVTSKPTVH